MGSFSELRNSEIKSVLGLKEVLMCRFEKRWRRNSGQFREGLISVYLQCLPCSNNNSKMSFGAVLHCRALIERFMISEKRAGGVTRELAGDLRSKKVKKLTKVPLKVYTKLVYHIRPVGV